MTDIHIPAAALEAGAKADYENWRDLYAVRGDTLEWEDIEPQLQNEHRSGVTAAILAALSAWPGSAVCHYTIGDDEGYEMVLPIPFPQESPDAKA